LWKVNYYETTLAVLPPSPPDDRTIDSRFDCGTLASVLPGEAGLPLVALVPLPTQGSIDIDKFV
jgi:hypothetical protein